jgi:hypothetical protein
MPDIYEEAMALLNRARADLGQAAAIIERERRKGRADRMHEALERILAHGGPAAAEAVWEGLDLPQRGSFGVMRNMISFMEADRRYAVRGARWGLASWADLVWEQAGQHSAAAGPCSPALVFPAARAFRPPNVVAKTLVTAGRLIEELGRPVTSREVAAAFKAEHGYELRPENVSGYLSANRRRFSSGPGGWTLKNTEAEREKET